MCRLYQAMLGQIRGSFLECDYDHCSVYFHVFLYRSILQVIGKLAGGWIFWYSHCVNNKFIIDILHIKFMKTTIKCCFIIFSGWLLPTFQFLMHNLHMSDRFPFLPLRGHPYVMYSIKKNMKCLHETMIAFICWHRAIFFL